MQANNSNSAVARLPKIELNSSPVKSAKTLTTIRISRLAKMLQPRGSGSQYLKSLRTTLYNIKIKTSQLITKMAKLLLPICTRIAIVMLLPVS